MCLLDFFLQGRTALNILTAWRDKNYISDNAWLTVYNEVVDLLNGRKAGEEGMFALTALNYRFEEGKIKSKSLKSWKNQNSESLKSYKCLNK